MKKIILIITLTALIVACTDKFEETNRSETVITKKSLSQDFNFGTQFATILRNVHVYFEDSQWAEDCGSDQWLRHSGIPTDEEGGRMGATYYMLDHWTNRMWRSTYNNVMSPVRTIKEGATEQGLKLFVAWADLLQLYMASKLTLYKGPIIYSEYGQDLKQYNYDSEEFLYKQFFDSLDQIQSVFQTYLDNKSPELQPRFDATYNGDLVKWLKAINTLRLRLAMRIVKANPDKAKEMFEKAVNDPAGLIIDNKDNWRNSLYNNVHPKFQATNLWNDSRMGAGMEEFLVGYKDPRLVKWFSPVNPEGISAEHYQRLISAHPDMPYKGVASGGWMYSRDDRAPYSRMSEHWDVTGVFGQHRIVINAAEVHFLFAEAALRGWATIGSKTAGEHYEDAVRKSFEFWQVDGVDVYLADNTSVPIDYVDPVDSSNDYKTRSTMTIKWNEEDSKEKKLEKIMTQKWIDSFSNTSEMWSDHRRTGYPRIHLAPRNESAIPWGVISNSDPFPFMLREPFEFNERMNNAAGVAEATKKLGGTDQITTPLWIHPNPGGPNF